MPTDHEVLSAIRDAHAASDTGELRYLDVATRLACPPDDEEFQRCLVRAVRSGLIEEIDSLDNLPGPTIFRYTP
jgi:hypothetical protein